MDFQPATFKRSQPCAGIDVSSQPFIPFAHTEQVPALYDPRTVPEQRALPYGSSSSGFQACDNSQVSPFPAKRRKLVGPTLMSPGDTSPGHYSQEEKRARLDSFGPDVHGQTSCWAEPAMSGSLSLGIPLARQMTNLSLLLCPCSGLGWDQAGGYCPLPEASPTAYDQNRSYEEQPYMNMAPQPGRDGFSFPESEKYIPLQCEETGPSLPLSGYPGQDHVQLASPPDSAKDILFSQGGSSMAHYAEGYATDLQSPDAAGFIHAYMQNDDQSYLRNEDESSINQAPDYSDHALSPHSATFQSVAKYPDVSQYGTMAVGCATSQAPLGNWSEPSGPHQPSKFDFLLPDQRGGKRGPFRDPKLRQQTAQTRRTGSCIRCRMQRIRCESDPEDPGGVCLTCTNVANTKAGRFPCLRYKITDMKLYKPGQVPGYEWTRRWTNSITDPIQKWASSDVKIVRVSAGFSKRCIELQVRRFIPQEGDKLARTWDVQGMKKSVAIPPYALIDLEATKTTYSSHIQDIMTDTIRHVLDTPDSLLCTTYFRAVQLMRDPTTPADSMKLLGLTLTLWVSIRLSTTSGFLVGDEMLGMSKNILDETSPDAGKIPMPPVLGAQLDLVLIHHIQTKLRREMLEILQKMILKNKQMTWFVTYLVTFILLHNTALITGHDAGYARKHGMKRRFAREDKVREYHLGANILLAHFHYCNKGMYPFTSECKDKELRTLADLSDDELEFVHSTREQVKRRRREWELIRASGAYEDDFFFVSQLFEEHWKPQSTI